MGHRQKTSTSFTTVGRWERPRLHRLQTSKPVPSLGLHRSFSHSPFATRVGWEGLSERDESTLCPLSSSPLKWRRDFRLGPQESMSQSVPPSPPLLKAVSCAPRKERKMPLSPSCSLPGQSSKHRAMGQNAREN